MKTETRVDEFKNPLKVEAGRKGGTATREKYGIGWLRENGKRGGRPRDKGYDEIRQQRRLERNNKKEETGPPGGALKTLKARYKLQSYRSSSEEIEPAELAQETPQEPALPGRKRGESPHA